MLFADADLSLPIEDAGRFLDALRCRRRCGDRIARAAGIHRTGCAAARAPIAQPPLQLGRPRESSSAACAIRNAGSRRFDGERGARVVPAAADRRLRVRRRGAADRRTIGRTGSSRSPVACEYHPSSSVRKFRHGASMLLDLMRIRVARCPRTLRCPVLSARHAAGPAIVAALALLATMVAMSRDFGFTWDERFQQKYGEQIWDYYHGRLPRTDVRYRPWQPVSLRRTGRADLRRGRSTSCPATPMSSRHMVIAIFGWLGIVFTGLLAGRAFGARAGWLAAALLAVSPRFFGDAMNNPKDAPFAALAIMALYYTLTIDMRRPRVSWPHAAKLALAIALAINVRPLGLVLLARLGGDHRAGRAWSRRFVRRIPIAGGRWRSRRGAWRWWPSWPIPAGTIAWPWAQASPYLRPFSRRS